MELTAQLSPIVVAEVLRHIAADNGSALFGIDARLDDLSVDVSWLQETADRYEHLWHLGTDVLPDVHGRIPTWLLACGSDTLGPDRFFSDINVKVSEHHDDAGRPRPASARPVAHAWTLGAQVTETRRTPALAAVSVNDTDVQGAFAGLAIHVGDLLKSGSEGPELACNAVVWRVAGVLEAMGNGHGLKAGCDLALNRVKGHVLDSKHDEFTSALEDFTGIRHALTHLREEGGLRFREVLDRYQPHELILTLTEVATLAVFCQVRDEQLDAPPSAVAWCLDQVDLDLGSAA